MFRPLPMRHVTIHLMTEELPRASLVLAEQALFSPDYRPRYDESFPSIPGHHYRELFHQANSRLQKIEPHIQLAQTIDIETPSVVSEDLLIKTNDWLAEVWKKCSSYEERNRHLLDEERMLDQLYLALDNFANLNIDLGLLKGEKLFLDIHVGILPRDNLNPLKEALSLTDYLIFNYLQHEESCHIVVVGPKSGHQSDIHSLLDTAGFQALELPPELQDEPDKVRENLAKRRLELSRERERQTQEMQQCSEQLKPELERARRTLVMAESYVNMETAARSAGALAIISGWVPQSKLPQLQAALAAQLQSPFHIESRKPSREENHLVPSYLPKNRLMSPFSTLVQQYGTPRYGEVDPTLIFALSFITMFGMMFGDIGHGLTIMIAAWLARSKLKSFTLFAICSGLASTLFGFLYGSLFGYEEIVHAIWIPPLSDPIYMLKVALIWGVGFLILITLVAIHNRIVVGEYSRAIFGDNGLVSILLYLTVLTGLYHVYQQGAFGIWPAVVSIAALFTLLAYRVIEIEASPGERILVAVIETFETLTGYISNTLSFLRVAAFSLNHVALAIAIFTLADMMDTTGQIIMVIFGNLFILVLEGAIVTIQALRLEYYEGFSRFFSGDGIEFKPLHLGSGVVK